MSLNEDVKIGEDVKRFIENPAMRDYFLGYKAEIVQMIIDAPIRDDHGVLVLKIMILQLEKFESHLKHYINTGKMASIQLERDQKITEFKSKNKFA